MVKGRKATGGILWNKLFLKILEYSQEMYLSLFLIKWQVFSSATLLKTESNTGVFLCILRNF